MWVATASCRNLNALVSVLKPHERQSTGLDISLTARPISRHQGAARCAALCARASPDGIRNSIIRRRPVRISCSFLLSLRAALLLDHPLPTMSATGDTAVLHQVGQDLIRSLVINAFKTILLSTLFLTLFCEGRSFSHCPLKLSTSCWWARPAHYYCTYIVRP